MATVAPGTSPAPGSIGPGWDPERWARDFPMLARQVRGQRLAYLDNAATSLRPDAVVDAMASYYREYSANVSRGVHTVSQEATDRFEQVRAAVARFVGANGPDEIVFTGGTTASLNLVAQSYALSVLRPGDEILASEMEHHSNLVPWHLVAGRTGAHVRGIPVTDAGEIDPASVARLLTERTRIVAITHASNVLGSIVPLGAVTELAHQAGAVCVVDGAQAAPHLAIDVRALGVDFYAFSPHKMFGPTGLGVLYGRRELLERMPPWQGGGGMIASVEIEGSTYAPPPARFEAGTPPIGEVFGLGAALEYLAGWDRDAALRYEDALLQHATKLVADIPGVTIYGQSPNKVSVLAFTVDGVHPHDVGTALDSLGVAVRAGHHCAQPLMRRFGVPGMVRASLAPYNTTADVDSLALGIERARAVFGR
jgi:cysteine desulfurase/selenocysteine lyase